MLPLRTLKVATPVAILFAAVLWPGTLRGSPADYTFTSLVDTTSGAYSNLQAPVINNSGAIAFRGTRPSGAGGIFTGPNPDTDGVVTSTSPFDIGAFTLNNNGAVAFGQKFPDGSSGIFIHTSSGTTNVADTNTGPFSDLRKLAMNDSGKVAFTGLLKTGIAGIFTGSNPATDTFVDTNTYKEYALDPADSFSNLDINNSGAIVFNGFLNNGPPTLGIFKGPNPVADKIATDSDGYSSFGGPSINDSGAVVFFANTVYPDEGFFKGPDPIADAIVTDAGDLDFFGSRSLNNLGELAFYAGPKNGDPSGIYTGPDAIADKVIAPGDTLFGGQLLNLQFGNNNLNDSGQIVFAYELNTGVKGIGLATPGNEPPPPPPTGIPLPAAVPATTVLLAGAATRSTWRRLRVSMRA